VITAFNGQAIKGPRDLALDVANTADGSTAKLTIFRDGNQSEVDVAIGQQPTQQTAALQSDDTGDAPVGMALTALNRDTQQQLGISPSVKGVVVAQVTPGSKAEESGVQSGDVIVRLAIRL